LSRTSTVETVRRTRPLGRAILAATTAAARRQEGSTVKKTYGQMLEEIELLKRQAEEVRRKEIAIVVARIRDAIAFYGLTEEDLGFRKVDKAASPTPPAPAPAKKKKRKSRYTERPLAGPVKR
jgi:DNA-binding protein H-NS